MEIKWPILRVQNYCSITAIDERERACDKQARDLVSRQLSVNNRRMALCVFLSLTRIHSLSCLLFVVSSKQCHILHSSGSEVAYPVFFHNEKVEEWRWILCFKDKTNSGSSNAVPSLTGVEIEAHGHLMNSLSGWRTGLPPQFRPWIRSLLVYCSSRVTRDIWVIILKSARGHQCGGFANRTTRPVTQPPPVLGTVSLALHRKCTLSVMWQWQARQREQFLFFPLKGISSTDSLPVGRAMIREGPDPWAPYAVQGVAWKHASQWNAILQLCNSRKGSDLQSMRPRNLWIVLELIKWFKKLS